jgi:hypothetical protein
MADPEMSFLRKQRMGVKYPRFPKYQDLNASIARILDFAAVMSAGYQARVAGVSSA